MGRGQGHARALAAAAALFLCGASTPTELPLRDARWLLSADLAADLTHEPPECRSPSHDAALRRSEEIGRIAFRAPLLLGGQAARAGLSCAACHRNGRTNTHFHFPGLSADAGTADVTASLMSSHRGDGIFNPKAIPDLAGDPAKFKVSRDGSKDDLKKFIHGLVTQEFDGPEPPPTVLDGLAGYVRSLSKSACIGPATTAIRLRPMLEDVEEAVRLAEQSYADHDQATARLLIGAARSMLGTIDERFQVDGGQSVRIVLREADMDLKAIELPDTAPAASFDNWRSRWPEREQRLLAAEPRSLFSERMIRRQLGKR